MATTYTQLLRDPRWQRRRLDILQRSDFSCEHCGAEDKTLNVHHRIYRKGAMPWEYEDDELVSLCESCHEQGHHTRELLKEEMASMNIHCLDSLLGYAYSIRVHSSWESDDVTQVPQICIQNAEQAAGLADGLWLEHPYDQEVNTPNPLKITTLLGMHMSAVERRQKQRKKGTHTDDEVKLER